MLRSSLRISLLSLLAVPVAAQSESDDMTTLIVDAAPAAVIVFEDDFSTAGSQPVAAGGESPIGNPTGAAAGVPAQGRHKINR